MSIPKPDICLNQYPQVMSHENMCNNWKQSSPQITKIAMSEVFCSANSKFKSNDRRRAEQIYIFDIFIYLFHYLRAWLSERLVGCFLPLLLLHCFDCSMFLFIHFRFSLFWVGSRRIGSSIPSLLVCVLHTAQRIGYDTKSEQRRWWKYYMRMCNNSSNIGRRQNKTEKRHISVAIISNMYVSACTNFNFSAARLLDCTEKFNELIKVMKHENSVCVQFYSLPHFYSFRFILAQYLNELAQVSCRHIHCNFCDWKNTVDFVLVCSSIC